MKGEWTLKLFPMFKVGTCWPSTEGSLTHHFRVLLQNIKGVLWLLSLAPTFSCPRSSTFTSYFNLQNSRNVFFIHLLKVLMHVSQQEFSRRKIKIGLMEWVGGTQIIAFQTSFPFPHSEPRTSVCIKHI